jgi:phosphate-selective porin OprO/OprP
MMSRNFPASPRARQVLTLALLASALTPVTANAQSKGDYAKLLERLNALEQKVVTLEGQNKALTDELGQKSQAIETRTQELADQVEFQTGRIEKVEVRAAKSAQPGVVPTFADVNGNFTFKVRGVVDADYVAFNGGNGGYDFNNGTAFRRARLGFEGTAFKNWGWRIETDFAGNAVAIQDAYIQYNGVKKWAFTLGQHKAPFGLESNNSDNYNSFIERSIFTNAIGEAGAERRLGASAQYVDDAFTVAFGLFGDNESSTRSEAAPDESWGLNARATWEPVVSDAVNLHVGASGFWRNDVKADNTAAAGTLRLRERPNVRVDGGRIIDTGTITRVNNLYYGGLEATAIAGPFSLTGEYGHLEVDRATGFEDVSFDGFYVYGSWFLTGESRAFNKGNFDRLKPFAPLNPAAGDWGGFELVARYDWFDVSDTPVVANAGNKADTYTLGLNWYFNTNFKAMFNWVHFSGTNTPLDPVGTRTSGDAFAARLHLDW